MERQAVAKVQGTPTGNNHLHRQSPASSSAGHPLLELQRSIGNQAVQRLIRSPYIQARLQISKPGDPFEHEADRVADTVMRMAEPQSTQEETTRIQEKPLATQMKGHGLTRAPNSAVGHGGGPNFHGQADPDFDGGKKAIAQVKTSRATGCDCPGKEPCIKATGTLVVTYKVKVRITMPPIPSNLSRCKQARVAAFLKNELGPHEQDHKRRFETYNGTTRQSIEALGCGKAEAKSALDTEAQRIYDDESTEREKAARDSSGKIDPFFRVVDFDGCP